MKRAKAHVKEQVSRVPSGGVAGQAAGSTATFANHYWDWAWIGCLWVWLLVCYYPSFSGPFAFDDYAIADSIERLPGWMEWRRPETRPLVTLSFFVERKLFGTSPFVHRFGNVLIHTIAAYLLMRLVRGAAERSQLRLLSPQHLAYVVATLWAIHPLQTESVAYIVQRGESLMGLFYFAFVYCLMRDAQQRDSASKHVEPPGDRSGEVQTQWFSVKGFFRLWLLLAVLCFLCGLWSKTVMITALVVGPMFDRAFLSGSWQQVLRARGWIYLAPVAAGLVAVLSILPGIMRGDANVGFGGDAPPLANYVAAQAKVFWLYLQLSCIPSDLSIDHGMVAPPFWEANLSWILLSVALAFSGVIAWLSDRIQLGFFILAPLVILSPTSSIIPTADLLVEHRMYVPLAVVLASLVVLGASLAGRSQDRRAKQLFLAIVIVCCAAFSFRTWLRSADYASGIALWSQAVKTNPTNDRAIQNLLDAFKREGDQGAEESQPLQAILLDAINTCETRGLATAIPLHRLGESLTKQGRFEEAIKVLREAIERESAELDVGYQPPQRYRSRAAMHVDLGISLMNLGQLPAALQELETAFTIHDQSADSRAIAGSLCQQLQRPHDARLHWERALELRPGWKEVESDLQQLVGEPAESASE